jgi:hypothetical protein
MSRKALFYSLLFSAILWVLIICGASAAFGATWYIGSDPSDDYATWAAFAAAETPSAGDHISFRRGDRFHEKIAISWSGASVANPIYLEAHGTGDKPEFWGAYVETGWSKTSGQTNVYECAASGGEMDLIHTTIAGVDRWIVYEEDLSDGIRMLASAADVAAVDATAGSCWYDAVNDKMYIHTSDSSNPATNGRTYLIPDIYATLTNDDTANRGYINISDLVFKYAGVYCVKTTNYDDTKHLQYVTFNRCEGWYSRHDIFSLIGVGIVLNDCHAYDGKENGGYIVEDIATACDIMLNNCSYTDTNGETTGQYADGALNIHDGANNVTVNNFTSNGITKAPIWSLDTGSFSNITINGWLNTGTCTRFIWLRDTNSDVTVSGFRSTAKCTTSGASVATWDSTDFHLTKSYLPGSTNGSGQGILLDGTTDMLVDYCVFHDFQYRAITGPSDLQDGAKIYNCVLYNNGVGAYIYDTSVGDPIPRPWLKNNIFLENGVGIELHASSGYPVSDYNCFYGQVTANFKIGAATGDLALWQSVTSQDLNSMEADPLLTDPANGQFMLRLGSPCRDQGYDWGQTEDYLGNAKFGAEWDMGAYEWFLSGCKIFFYE